jgi:hypothetical protein
MVMRNAASTVDMLREDVLQSYIVDRVEMYKVPFYLSVNLIVTGSGSYSLGTLTVTNAL